MANQIKFYNGPKLERLLSAMSNKPIDWDRVFTRMRGLPCFIERPTNLTRFLTWITETHLDLLVEGACIESDISLDEDVGKLSTHPNGDYYIERTLDGRRIIRRRDPRNSGYNKEFDKLLVVDGRPVIIEISIDKKPKKIMRVEQILGKRFVLSEVLGTEEIGFVTVMPINNYRGLMEMINDGRDNPSTNAFINGARAVPLYADGRVIVDDIMRELGERIPSSARLIDFYRESKKTGVHPDTFRVWRK